MSLQTDTTERVLAFLKTYPKKTAGQPRTADIAPTLAEIATQFSITKGSVQYHLNLLKEDKLITWTPGEARSITVTKEGRREGD